MSKLNVAIEALKFYAHGNHKYSHPENAVSDYHWDNGKRAREALATIQVTQGSPPSPRGTETRPGESSSRSHDSGPVSDMRSEDCRTAVVSSKELTQTQLMRILEGALDDILKQFPVGYDCRITELAGGALATLETWKQNPGESTQTVTLPDAWDQARAYVEAQDYMNDENRNAAGNGYVAGWRDRGEAAPAAQQDTDELRLLKDENARLKAQLNNPLTDDFVKAVIVEAAHQRERWATTTDEGKTDADWFWLIGYLAGKALTNPLKDGDMALDKRLHRIITVAAAACNWHSACYHGYTDMRPGIAEPKQVTRPEGGPSK